ncbi:hypothetical protein BSKO_08613 [Bryopsis sp. KO-2023]|nr:hypothetical protein BSKO_08613 [Bryopsis sp. KO-2023]
MRQGLFRLARASTKQSISATTSPLNALACSQQTSDSARLSTKSATFDTMPSGKPARKPSLKSGKLKPSTDPTSDILRSKGEPLRALFNPKSVAVVGATDRPGSVGRTLLWNLISSPFGGTVFPINPKRNSVLGIRAHASIKDTPEPVDLAVIVTPARTVPGIIRDCVEAEVPGAIILSAGFKEIGEEGVALEKEILDQVESSGLRIIGPNCLGLMNPLSGLNATFASTMARAGNVGFISQSGALCTSVLDWSLEQRVGFSAFVSVGSMLDVNWGDLIYFLGDDPRTHSIVIYMESIGNARAFLSAAREVALTKPIIVIKAGRTAEAAKAAASHTGSLAGSDAVLDAAFRRCGVLRVKSISQLFNLAEVLSKQDQRLPAGPRLTIITNAGGPGVLATDALIEGNGELSPITDETKSTLNGFLPTHWSHGNPIDILGDAGPERYSKTLEVALKDPNSDGLLVVLTPQAMTDPTQTAQGMKSIMSEAKKPVLASWMGGADIRGGQSILNQSNIPTYDFPDDAAEVFNLMWKYKYNLEELYETPTLLRHSEIIDQGPHNGKGIAVEQIIKEAVEGDRTILTETESKRILQAYGIPTVQSIEAKSEEEAAQAAEKIGYPVVVKIVSKTITHKTDVGGVQLDIATEKGVRDAFTDIRNSVAEKVGDPEKHFEGVSIQPMINRDDGYELIVGSSMDPQFGPVLLFGTGGSLVEVFKDSAIALPPLNTTLARRMMEQTKIYAALKGVRGRSPANLGQLESLLVLFSQLVVEQPQISEIDVNPLLVCGKDSRHPLLALDARIALHPKETDLSELPAPAIRPYPAQYTWKWTLPDGTACTIRPIRPEDEPLVVKFHENLSEDSVYFRYFHTVKLSQRTSHTRMARVCFVDYDREMALVAERTNAERTIIGVCRLSRSHTANEAEFTMVVGDAHQRKGVGSELLGRLIEIGKEEGIKKITAQVLMENRAMQRVCEKLGFVLDVDFEDEIVSAELTL